MRISSLVIAVAALAPTLSGAATSANLGVEVCTGLEASSVIGLASFSCSGDFSLQGGSIESDSTISIAATGSLVLDNIALFAPVVELISLGGDLRIGNGTEFNAKSVSLVSAPTPSGGGYINVASGATISIGGGVPIPILDSSELIIQAPNISPTNVGTITLASPVPEPNAELLTLSAALVFFVRSIVAKRTKA